MNVQTASDAAVTTRDYFPLIGAAIGGFIGAAGGFLSKWLLERSRLRAERKQLAYAFKGEILAILSIAQMRHYVAGFEKLIVVMKQTGKPIVFPVSITREYFNVFNANVSKIGFLKSPLPEEIARFYTQANSILDDFASRGSALWQQAPVEVAIELNQELIAIMTNTFILGDEIAARIDTLYG